MINIKYEEQQRHAREKDRGDISDFTITLFATHSLRVNSTILIGKGLVFAWQYRIKNYLVG